MRTDEPLDTPRVLMPSLEEHKAHLLAQKKSLQKAQRQSDILMSVFITIGLLLATIGIVTLGSQ